SWLLVGPETPLHVLRPQWHGYDLSSEDCWRDPAGYLGADSPAQGEESECSRQHHEPGSCRRTDRPTGGTRGWLQHLLRGKGQSKEGANSRFFECRNSEDSTGDREPQ